MTIHRPATLALIVWLAVAPAMAFCDSRQISREQVLRALKAGFAGTGIENLEFGAEQISAPAVPSRGNSELRMVGYFIDARAHAIDVRLECKKYACLPFYVTLSGIEIPDGVAARQIFRTKDSPRLIETGQSGNRAVLVRSGEHAELSLERNAVRLSVPVVCLQTGLVGQTIRTRIVGTTRIITAQVTGRGRLSGITAGEQGK